MENAVGRVYERGGEIKGAEEVMNWKMNEFVDGSSACDPERKYSLIIRCFLKKLRPRQ